MATYRYAGLILSADFPFPELPRESGRAFVRLTIGARRRRDERRQWRHLWRIPRGRIWMQVAAAARGYIVQFPGYAEFAVTPGSIVCHPRVGVPLRTVRHLLLDQLLPAVLASRGRLVLHASAVDIGGRAVAFLGIAGTGKSTVAAALVRGGASVLTDDALVIDWSPRGPRVVPSYPGLRLWPASARLVGAWRVRRTPVAHYTRKQRWFGAAVPFCGHPRPLVALYVIRRGKTFAIRSMSARSSIMALVQYSMLLDATDRSALRFGFELATRVVEEVPVRRLVMPAGARALRELCSALNQGNPIMLETFLRPRRTKDSRG